MIDRLRHALGIKSDAEVAQEVSGEPSVRKARKALARSRKWTGITDDILDDYEAAERRRSERWKQ